MGDHHSSHIRRVACNRKEHPDSMFTAPEARDIGLKRNQMAGLLIHL